MEEKIKRCQSGLYYGGLAYIEFAVWTVLKVASYKFLGEGEELRAAFEGIEQIEGVNTDMVINITLILVIIIDLSFRLFVGMSAIGESKGKRKGWIYLIFVIFMIFYSTYVNIQTISTLKVTPDNVISIVSSLFIEVTSFITKVWILVMAIRLRVAERKQASVL